MSEVGYIYFVASEAQDAFKVGWSATFNEERVHKLQTGNPDPLKLIGWLIGDRNAEQHIHRLLKPWHRRLEWFKGADLAWFLFNDLEEASTDMDDDLTPLTPEVIDEYVPIALCAYFSPEESISESDVVAFRQTMMETYRT